MFQRTSNNKICYIPKVEIKFLVIPFASDFGFKMHIKEKTSNTQYIK